MKLYHTQQQDRAYLPLLETAAELGDKPIPFLP